MSKRTLFTHKAKSSLKFVIVGGGIAGLACAYNLQQAGHSATVLEKDNAIGKASGGVRSPPNMTRLLLKMGLEEKLNAISTVCTRIAFKLGATMEHIGSLLFHKEVMRELDADVLLLHHADLHRMLYDLALESGAMVALRKEVVADIIIGADGEDSLVRQAIVGRQENHRVGPYTSYACSVPIELVEEDAELKEFTSDSSWNIFMGNNKCILTHLACHGRQLAFVIFISDSNIEAKPGWANKLPLSTLDLSDFDTRLQRLVDMAPFAIQTQHLIQERLEDWYHPSNKLLVLGEAAHLLNPGGSHGTSMAMEDAAVLGCLFSRLQSRHQTPHLLTAFQNLRQDRCQAVISSEYGKMEFPCMPAGEMQRARDAALRKQSSDGLPDADADDFSEDYLREQFEEFMDVYGYDAYDAAENWWVEWGMLLERSMINMEHRPGIVDALSQGDTDNHLYFTEESKFVIHTDV